MPYNILILGAAYGSLLASKMLFGGHKIHHICLPAEADLINAEGFRVRLPVKGRKDPVLLDSHKLPGKVTASGAQGINPKDYDLIGLAMQEPQYRSPGVRELLDAVAKSQVPCMSIMNMPPLPYVKRIPGLDYAALKPAYTDARVWDSFDPELPHAVQPRSAGDPPAGREGQRADGHAADQLQGGEVRRREGHGDPAPAREGDRRDPLRSGRRHQDRAAGEAARLRLASSCRSPSGRCCSPATTAASPRTACAPRRRPCTPIRRPRSRSTTSCSISASSSAPTRPTSCRTRNMRRRRSRWCVRRRPRAPCRTARRTSSAPTSWCSSSPGRRACSHPAIDAQVALVDRRIEANRKKAAAA